MIRIQREDLLRLPEWCLSLCVARTVDKEAVCLLTCVEGQEINAPVMASDGHVYDSVVLRRWLQLGFHSVIPGCEIRHVDIELRGAAALRMGRRVAYGAARRLAHSICKRPRSFLRHRPQKKCIHMRVWDTYKLNRPAPSRGGLVLNRDADRSAFSSVS